jgi:hypothetical protein
MITKMTITYYDIIFFIQFLLAYFHFGEFIPLMLLSIHVDLVVLVPLYVSLEQRALCDDAWQ